LELDITSILQEAQTLESIKYHNSFLVWPFELLPDLTLLILEYIEGSKVSNVGTTDMSILLPMDSVALFPSLLSALEDSTKKKELGIKTFGIAMTTLEGKSW
jgi:hypothetical protein